jgi:hypothetical protein
MKLREILEPGSALMRLVTLKPPLRLKLDVLHGLT